MLRLENINIVLGKNTKLERKVLNYLNLDVKEGEFVVVIGGNGAGKSTMFNIISGFIKPDSGKVFILKQDITNTSQIYRANLVSKVMQDPKSGTMENMTILENMAFALKRGQKRGLQLFTNKNRTRLFREKLSTVNMGLENRIDDLVSNLSGGQRQVLSIVMAMLQDSKILLLDEITAALDPASSEYTIELTNQIVRKQKLTCIMITHNMAHAIKYGDRLLLLKNGSFVKEYDKVTKSVLTPAELAAEFGEI
ncbi:ABC transporter ATP-binding protein [Candidatus Lariskella endosymbiont of Epinotia ramella]|uniref:ABC transporter ATP-binding protein n=1 Tax=Candidatus Lariskella endosymbiont of Epinotia ramella TaxID=3066224 RepID=UPI0030D4EFAC